MRGNPNFRDPAFRQRALEARNNGNGKAHSSWNALAEARRKSERMSEAEVCPFDRWLVRVEARVADIMSEARLGFLRSQEGLGYGEDIPF
jgi:hypothetical protein